MTRSLTLMLVLPVFLASGSALAAHGDLVISEIMMSPNSNTDDWFEVYNPGSAAVDLTGCTVIEHVGSSGKYEPKTIEPCKGCGMTVPPGTFVIFGTNKPETQTCVGYESPKDKDCGYPVDFGASSVNLASDEEDSLSIECGGTVVDEVVFDWTDIADQCALGARGCSAFLQYEQLDADANDNWPAAWAVSDDSTSFYDDQRLLSYGSPGIAPEEGAGNLECPAIGALVFTELMMDPANGEDDSLDMPDWFEVMNTSDQPIDMRGMRFEYVKVAGQDEDSTSTPRTSDFAVSTSLILQPGQAQVFSYKACLDATEMDEGSLCPDGEYVEGAIELSTSAIYHLAVTCLLDDGSMQEVDVLDYDPDQMNLEDGHSQIFDPSAHSSPDQANDSMASWCMAGWDLLCLDNNGVCNYASPGEIGPCTTEILTPPAGPSCRCSATGGPAAWASAALMALIGLLARRPRGPRS